MNSLISFSNKGKKWTDEQDDLLRQQYDTHLMNITDIAKAHLRTVGSIVSRLKNLDILSPYLQSEEYSTSVRGYTEYLQDTEFIEAEKETRKKKEKSPLSLLHPNRDTNTDDDIKEIKKDIKEILTFLQSIYEFEKE